ncbi:MAG: HU family DNA-binding protein [Thermodesulfobacteriota bacterium]|nr:HU family DNA-binding protein [Thermodesulfobacteriota bacterium]
MALTKVQLVASIHNQIDLTQKRSSEIVETLLEIIKSTLASGEDVLVNGFGKFCVKHKDEPNYHRHSKHISLGMFVQNVFCFCILCTNAPYHM